MSRRRDPLGTNVTWSLRRITTFLGLDFASWGAGRPPDTVGDVGPAYYIQAGLGSRRGGVFFALLLIITFGGRVFNVQPLDLLEWAWVIVVTSSVLVFAEAARKIRLAMLKK